MATTRRTRTKNSGTNSRLWGKLFDELFPFELKEMLWEHKNQISAIQVISARLASSKVEASSWLAYAVYGDPNARLLCEVTRAEKPKIARAG